MPAYQCCRNASANTTIAAYTAIPARCEAADYNKLVTRRIPPACWLAVPVLFALYLYGLGACGLLGPDEPRYASIAREMARSGDWITPRLWGEPWFEKPALLYWMAGAGYRLGLGPEFAPRLPVAILSVAFLVFFVAVLRREFGARAAWFAGAILATSAGWLGYSYAAVTDLPLSATFAAALLLSLRWVQKGETRALPAAAALLGLAVLAKGLVPVVLVVPLVWMARRRWRDLARWRVILPFATVALPWYLACYAVNGRAFIDKFFLEHHFARFASGSLLHGQPAWFYVPVLLAGLVPWTPLIFLLFRRATLADPRKRLLTAVAVFGLVFFSASTNKLPGYLLPLLPGIAALMGTALDEARDARSWLAGCALGLIFVPVIAQLLPAALAAGLSHAPRPEFNPIWAAPVGIAALCWLFEAWGRRTAAVTVIVVSFTAGVLWIKVRTLPAVDRNVSARILWQEIGPASAEICVGDISRAWRYGLNYYSVQPLPDCTASPRPARLDARPGERPRVEASPPAQTAAVP